MVMKTNFHYHMQRAEKRARHLIGTFCLWSAFFCFEADSLLKVASRLALPAPSSFSQGRGITLFVVWKSCPCDGMRSGRGNHHHGG
jgi:hypothetical protein